MTINKDLSRDAGKERSLEKLAIEKVEVAISALQMQDSFFSSFLGILEHEVLDMESSSQISSLTSKIKTCATDGKTIYYNPEFMETLSGKEAVFLVGHELLHCIFLHLIRKGNRDSRVWNVACDYAVNSLLVENNIGSMPKTALYKTQYKDLSAEEIYDLIYQKMKDISSSLDLGDSTSNQEQTLDDHDFFDSLSDEQKQGIERNISSSIDEALKKSTAVSNSILKSILKDSRKSKVAWKEILRANIQSLNKADYSYYKLNRKTSQQGIYLPSLKKDLTISIVVALDSSGSVSETELEMFLTEVISICKQFSNIQLTLFSFDTQVHNPKTFNSDNLDTMLDEIKKYKIGGRGGTMFECIFEYLKKENIAPEKLLIFTDMIPNYTWGDPYYAETLFASTCKEIKAPYGETVYIGT